MYVCTVVYDLKPAIHLITNMHNVCSKMTITYVGMHIDIVSVHTHTQHNCGTLAGW